MNSFLKIQLRHLFHVLFFSLAVAFSSCADWSKGKFILINHTPHPIDSISISPDKNSEVNYISLKPNETKNYTTDMSGFGSDGSYMIQYKKGPYKNFKVFGYYSNGNSMEKINEVYFETDSIRIVSIY